MAVSEAPYLVRVASTAAQDALRNAQSQSSTVLGNALRSLDQLGYSQAIGAGNLSVKVNLPTAPVLEPPKMSDVYQITKPVFDNPPVIDSSPTPMQQPSRATKPERLDGLNISVAPFVPATKSR